MQTLPSTHHLGLELPGGREGRQQRDRAFTITVSVTGRCNAHCTYCHYYHKNDRKGVAFDISDDQFGSYMEFVREWSATVPGTTNYRFSGGDPMVLGDRLFTLANRGFDITGKKPFILTAGKALNLNWAEKARKSSISYVAVSIENPIDPDKGAPNPHKVIEQIVACNSKEMPIRAGQVVIPNHCFKHLYETCSWFYSELGEIPTISEINYDAYTPLSEQEWLDLEVNLERVVRDFAHRTPLRLFPSVTPELNFGFSDAYVFELDLGNSYGINSNNLPEKIEAAKRKLVQSGYIKLDCPRGVSCPCWDFCDNTKWYWQGDRKNSSSIKLRDYCRFKKVVMQAYCRALVDSNYTDDTPHVDSNAYFSDSGRLQLLPAKCRALI